MPDGYRQTDINRNKYMPPDVAKAMDQHFQNNMPSHLKQYVSGNSSGYVPRGMQDTLSKELQKNLPDHLKGYSDAFIEQSVMNPMLTNDSTPRSSNLPPHPIIPDKLKRDHSIPYGEQYTVDPETLPLAANKLFESESPIQNKVNNNQPGQHVTTSPYDFILNPEEKKRQTPGPSLPGLPSNLSKILLVVGGLFIVIIFIVIISSLIKGASNTPKYTAVLQDQNELGHLSLEASQVNSLPTNYLNFVANTQLTVGSAANQLTNYLSINGIKISPKLLLLKESSVTDNNLKSSQVNGNYNQYFVQVMQTQLNTYASDLTSAYNSTKGIHGRRLLANFYKQASLLDTELKQVNGT